MKSYLLRVERQGERRSNWGEEKLRSEFVWGVCRWSWCTEAMGLKVQLGRCVSVRMCC